METRRLAAGFGWGLVATLVMSILMIIAVATGLSPMPKPIPAAIVGKVVGGVVREGIPQPAIVALTVASHFGLRWVLGYGPRSTDPPGDPLEGNRAGLHPMVAHAASDSPVPRLGLLRVGHNSLDRRGDAGPSLGLRCHPGLAYGPATEVARFVRKKAARTLREGLAGSPEPD
jgi:hypothetical protein